jgi:hypothetical protein
METYYLNWKKGRNLYLKRTRLWAFSEDRSPVTRIGNRGVFPTTRLDTAPIKFMSYLSVEVTGSRCHFESPGNMIANPVQPRVGHMI